VLCCRYLEQCHDNPLQALILTLQQEKAKLGADLSEAVSRASSLEVSVWSIPRQHVISVLDPVKMLTKTVGKYLYPRK
jgi:hypothetical protein